MKKRLLSVLLTLAMLLTLLPIAALAAGDEQPQAKWGADADNLTEEGTFAQALAAAAETDSTVGYIQLVSDVTAADEQTHTASGGTFTLDLNGHTLTGGKGGDGSLGAAPGKPALTVAGADVTITGQGTLQGGQGGTYDRINMNRGGPGVRVNSGKLTVDSDGVNVTIGLPGESCTAADFATNGCGLEIRGGEAVLKAGTVDASEKKNADDEVIQRGGDAIAVYGGLLTVPQGSTLRATATGGNSGLSITGATANIAGGAFGGAPFDYIPPDISAAPQRGIDMSIGTCNISGGSFVGRVYGAYWGGSGRVALSGGHYYGGDRAMEASGVTYASLLEEGSSFVYPVDNRILTDEEELARQGFLSVTSHTHAMSVDCSTEHGDQVEFTPWDKTDSLPETAGNYYLTTDVALTSSWIAPREVTINLCLNGHKVTSTSFVINIENYTTLNLCDCQGTGSLSTDYTAITFLSHSTLHLYGGAVSGKSEGVDVFPSSTFHMHGGSVKGATSADSDGLGVFVKNGGTFLMDGGTISGNKRGVYVSPGGAFQAKGDVVIKDNTLGNVVLDGEGSHMELSGALGPGAKIGLSASDWATVTADSPKLAVQGAGERTVSQTDYAKLFCDNDQYKLTLKDDGKVYVRPASFTVRYENGMAVVDAPTAGDYTVIFAAYDADHRLTDLAIENAVSAPEGETTVIPKNFTPDATVKVMLLDSLTTLRPLCPAATWTK